MVNCINILNGTQIRQELIYLIIHTTLYIHSLIYQRQWESILWHFLNYLLFFNTKSSVDTLGIPNFELFEGEHIH